MISWKNFSIHKQHSKAVTPAIVQVYDVTLSKKLMCKGYKHIYKMCICRYLVKGLGEGKPNLDWFPKKQRVWQTRTVPTSQFWNTETTAILALDFNIRRE